MKVLACVHLAVLPTWGEAGYGRISVLARVHLLVHPNGVEGEVLSLQGGGGEGWGGVRLGGVRAGGR